MPTTITHNISYPSGSQAPNVPVVMQTTAESVDAALTELGTGNLAKGLVYFDKVTTGSASVSDAIINHITTFTFKAGRRYRIVWDTSFISGGASSLFYCSINFTAVGSAPSSTAGLTTLNGRTIHCPLAGSTTYSGPITTDYKPTVDTTTMIKFWALRVVGGDLISVVGNSNEYALYQIYDDGAQI